MMRVVALNAPDSKVAERRFRSRFTSSAAQQQQQQVPQEGESGEGERAVALCMELVHREGCAVAEEANEILRCVCKVAFALRKGGVCFGVRWRLLCFALLCSF